MDLTGHWSCNDNGFYNIRQLGNTIWWYGQGGDRRLTKGPILSICTPDWSNVANGKITGSTLTLDWADVPNGKTDNMGRLTLKIVSQDELAADPNFPDPYFGGTHWKRVKYETPK